MTPVRRHHRRPRWRGALLTVVAAWLAVTAVGVLVTDRAERAPGASLAAQPTPVATEAPGAGPDPGPGADLDQLLEADQLARLGPGARWRVDPTGTRPDGVAAYDSCDPERHADPRREAAYVRRFTTTGRIDQVAVQAVEVSRTPGAAAAAFRRLVRSYAGCRIPRVQLLASFAVPRPGTDVVGLELRRWSSPVRSITVALAHTGVVSTVLVHEVDRPQGPPRAAVARTVGRALGRLCTTSGGRCGGEPTSRPVPPPATGEARGFLGAVDLPPVDELQSPWVGTAPATARSRAAATLCDPTAFGAARRVRSRTFVLPNEQLPALFGLTQTVGVLGSPAAAGGFVDRTSTRIGSCPDRLLSASVSGGSTVHAGDVRGRVWRLTYKLPGAEVFYRIGLVHAGRAVSQLAFSPTAGFDPGPAFFDALVVRAGQRLAELRVRG